MGPAALGVVGTPSGVNTSDVGQAAVRSGMIDGVQAVVLVAGPLAALALAIVLWPPELALSRTR